MRIDFVKMQGAGNDYLYIDNLAGRYDNVDWGALSRRMSDRHFGVGADGIIAIFPSHIAPFRMRMWNADGSEGRMCGNGMRCFARYLYDRGLVRETEFPVETLAGLMVPRIIVEDGRVRAVRVDMGRPILEPEQIPVIGLGNEPIIEQPLEAEGHSWPATVVSMGNSHVVVFTHEVDNVPLADWGPKLEHHPAFPERTNVEFARVNPDGSIRMRVWERGSGHTLACGTGACATLIAAYLTGRSGRRARLELDGGAVEVEWDSDDRVYLTGPAEEVFTGVYQLEEKE